MFVSGMDPDKSSVLGSGMNPDLAGSKFVDPVHPYPSLAEVTEA